jgi:response regulator RpfG family c-di-GMP phosphodiesterase
MVQEAKRSVMDIYNKNVLGIIIAIHIVILSVLALALTYLNQDNKNGVLVNILGRQRMLTQVIAKDANRIFELETLLNTKDLNGEQKQVLIDKLDYTLKDLQKSREEYNRQYLTIHEGYININNKSIGFKGALQSLAPIFERHDPVWPIFNKSVDILLAAEYNSDEYIEAIEYINENNELILTSSDQITNVVLDYNKQKGIKLYYLILGLALFVLITLIFAVRKAYKDLFVPVSQLYSQMADMGVTGINEKKHELEKEGLEPIYKEVDAVFNKLNSLIMLIENLNKNIPFNETLEYIFSSFSEYIPYTHIGVALIDDKGKTIRASYGVHSDYHKNLGKRLLGLKADVDATSLKKVIEHGTERIINDLESYVKKRPSKEYNEILLEEGVRASITFPLRNNKGTVVGIIFFSSNMKHAYNKEHIRFLKTLANSIMFSLEKDILNQDLIISSTLALASLTDERDPETGEHLQRMSTYARILAELLSEEEKYKSVIDINYINDIERFSPLHDIGKVAIRDDILLKPGKLTTEEFEIMKKHALYGAKVMRLADENIKKRGRSIFGMAIEIAEGHHEKWDGSGYPYGKSGEDIPLSARIVAMADVLDALTSRRPYKEPFSFETAVRMIEEASGKQFDPGIVRIFKQHIKVIEGTYLEFKEKNILD